MEKHTGKNKDKKKFIPKTSKARMSHIKGIPPSPNWANRNSAIIFLDNLLYISNNYIVNIDLKKKEFYQLLTSNNLQPNDKYSIIIIMSDKDILCVSESGCFFSFVKYYNTNALEDNRIYFRDGNLNDSNLRQHQKKFKAGATSFARKILILGDSLGCLNLFKFYFTPELEMKFVLDLKIFKHEVTNLVLIDHFDMIITSSSEGEIALLKFVNNDQLEILSRINLDKCFIFSIDHLLISERNLLLSTIDKNGTWTLIGVKYMEGENSLTSQILLQERNKFNDKGIMEPYLFFTVKFLQTQTPKSLLITSNQGRVFHIELDESNELKSHKGYKELPENPSTMAIYNILNYEQNLVFISADHCIISYTSELSYDFDFKTLASKPQHLLVKHKVYIITSDNMFLQYNISNKFNGLNCVLRKCFSNGRLSILNISQSELRDSLFSLLVEDERSRKSLRSIIVYDFSSDSIVNRLDLESDDEVLDQVFTHMTKKYERNDTNWLSTLFGDSLTYELHLTLTKSGTFTIWDYISNKRKTYNTVQSMNEKSLGSRVIPVTDREAVIIVNTFHDKVAVALMTQMFHYKLLEFPYVGHLLYDGLFTRPMSVILILSGNELRAIRFDEDFYNHTTLPCDYENYLHVHDYFSKFSKAERTKEFLYQYSSNVGVNNLVIYKDTGSSVQQDDDNTLTFALTQVDGVMKVFKLDNTFKLTLIYSINAHLNKITHVAFFNKYTVISCSLDHSLKTWNLNLCKLIDVELLPVQREEVVKSFMSNFNKVSSMCLFQQSFKSAGEFVTLYEKCYIGEGLIQSEDPNFLLFAYTKDPGLNQRQAAKLLVYQMKHTTNKDVITNLLVYSKQFGLVEATRDMLDICKHLDFFTSEQLEILNREGSFMFDKFITENDMNYEYFRLIESFEYEEALNYLLSCNQYVEALILIKLAQIPVEKFLSTLDKLKSFIFQKQTFQADKIQRVITIIKHYFNIK